MKDEDWGEFWYLHNFKERMRIWDKIWKESRRYADAAVIEARIDEQVTLQTSGIIDEE